MGELSQFSGPRQSAFEYLPSAHARSLVTPPSHLPPTCIGWGGMGVGEGGCLGRDEVNSSLRARTVLSLSPVLPLMQKKKKKTKKLFLQYLAITGLQRPCCERPSRRSHGEETVGTAYGHDDRSGAYSDTPSKHVDACSDTTAKHVYHLRKHHQRRRSDPRPPCKWRDNDDDDEHDEYAFDAERTGGRKRKLRVRAPSLWHLCGTAHPGWL